MRIFKTKAFARWARKQKVKDPNLWDSAFEVVSGNHDAELGGNLFKKRVALAGGGKRAGARTIIAYKSKWHLYYHLAIKRMSVLQFQDQKSSL